jgi:L-amino acid N-acyltransferase
MQCGEDHAVVIQQHLRVFSILHPCSSVSSVTNLPRMHLRLATETDLPAINDIYNHYVLTSTTTYQEVPDTLDDRRAWFRGREPRHVVTVAEVDGVVVGWASLNVFRARSAYRFSCENSVYVERDHFRKGIGGALLGDSIERGRLAGFKTILAGIDAEQLGSIALHAKHGFVECGHMKRVGYKFDRWLDVVFMQRML